MRPKDHGRAVIHVSPDAGPIKFTKASLVDRVKSMVDAGSIVFQVGIWRGARERSAQVLLINGGSRDVLRWSDFRRKAMEIAATLCADMMQHAVMIELMPSNGRYVAHTFENDLGEDGVKQQRTKAVAFVDRRRRPR